MNYTLEEIRKHKNKIYDLSNKLINTFDINQEIMVNNEIKYEAECLLSLLNIKKNEINNINNQNNINFNMNNNFQQMDNQPIVFEQQQQMMIAQQMALMQQQMMAQQQEAMRQEQMNNILNNIQNKNENKFNTNIELSLYFKQNWEHKPPIYIECNSKDKVSDIIEKYRNKANDYDDSKKFIFNARNLNPSLSLVEAGIKNNSNIFVCRSKGIKRITDDRNS